MLNADCVEIWGCSVLVSYHKDFIRLLGLAQNMVPREGDQDGRVVESPGINPCTYEKFIFNKGGKSLQWRASSINGAEKNGLLSVKEWN